MFPVAIDEGAGKERVLVRRREACPTRGAGYPVGQGFTRIVVWVALDCFCAKAGGRYRLLGLLGRGRGNASLMINDFFAWLAAGFASNARKECGESIVIPLAPSLKWVM